MATGNFNERVVTYHAQPPNKTHRSRFSRLTASTPGIYRCSTLFSGDLMPDSTHISSTHQPASALRSSGSFVSFSARLLSVDRQLGRIVVEAPHVLDGDFELNGDVTILNTPRHLCPPPPTVRDRRPASHHDGRRLFTAHVDDILVDGRPLRLDNRQSTSPPAERITWESANKLAATGESSLANSTSNGPPKSSNTLSL